MAEEKKSTARRDALQQIELDVQQKWEELKVFEEDAPKEGGEKFLCTFPYPYMNGLLHIGHAFSMTKAVFAAHFQRLLGKKALFPFGFHCTGMPIQAAANKLKREFEVYGQNPVFPAGRPTPALTESGAPKLDGDSLTLSWKAPAHTGGVDIKAYHLHVSLEGGAFAEVCEVPQPDPATLAKQGKKVIFKTPIKDGSCVYKVLTELVNGKYGPESKESDEVSIDAAPKDKKGSGGPPGKRVAKKILAKSGDAAFQWEILRAMDFQPNDIPPFVDPLHWLEYFPPLGARDLKRFGAPVDFRRSFITTSINPFYDQFIRWQFRKLKASEKIGFGKRATIFSEMDGQACMDHDRAEGEGVAPQEYTGIKLKVLEHPPVFAPLKGKTVYLIAATLRPETMVGQTNCWILPEGNYGCFKASDTDVFVCSHRAARNMSFQDVLMPWGKPECLLDIKGSDIMGCKLDAPTSKYPAVHLLPLLTIKMDKGTGVVTSVPSDSPDDYAAYMDLKKPGKLAHHGLKAEWIEPFDLIPIIDVELPDEDGNLAIRNMAAPFMCELLKVQSQKDTEKLHIAHDACYKNGFDKGIMTAGPMKGKPVKVAKPALRDMMVKDGQAVVYSEPEKKVVSRSGDECVVAGIDQWYLKYGEEGWKKQIEDHLVSKNWLSYNDRIKESFGDAINWLKEWACSRSFGLGTKVPWDEQFVIESLSDSTIYMAYYTIAHMLQGGDIMGQSASPCGIKPEDLTDDVFDYVFLNGKMPKGSKIKKDVLEKMQREFRFWYPMDLRVSGKDLIQNHLTMCLYNHACVWEAEPDMWPKGFFCNGWLMVNNEKMSKSKGNFFTMKDIMEKYSADSVRMACANAGDTLEDANLEEQVADDSIMAFYTLRSNLDDFLTGASLLADEKEDVRYVDRWFMNEMVKLVGETKKYYEAMYFREALRTGYFMFKGRYEKYLDICRAGIGSPNKTLIMRYFEWQTIILSPIAPHFCEHIWSKLGKTGSVLQSRWPEPTVKVDPSIVAGGDYMFSSVPHDFTTRRDKIGKPESAVVYVAKNFPDWKVAVLKFMREKLAAGKVTMITQDALKENASASEQWKELIKNVMQDAECKKGGKHVGPFAAFKRDEAAEFGASALEATVPFDEMKLMLEHVTFLKAKLGIEISVRDSEDLKDASHAQAASAAQPGTPGVHFEGVTAPAAKAKAKAGGDKAAPKAKAAAKENGKAFAKENGKGSFSDLKTLDAHLSTRSYIEGGPKPSAADAAQLAAMPSSVVSAEEFPHVARWLKHIKSFAPPQRSSWK